MLDSLRLWILWQLSLTAFLVAVMVILKVYASTAFFSYWMKAWTFFGMALACSWFALDRALAAGPLKWLLICVSLVLSFLQVSCLFLGAFSLRIKGPPSRGLREVFLAGAVSLALLTFLCTFLLREYPLVSYAVRSCARCAALGAVFLYAAVVVARHMHYRTSRGARFVTWCCAAYAAVQAIELWNALTATAFDYLSPFRQNLFLLDGACEAAMTISMVLLLVERSRRFHQRLELYESILPTCAVCGAIRDDPAPDGAKEGGCRWRSSSGSTRLPASLTGSAPSAWTCRWNTRAVRAPRSPAERRLGFMLSCSSRRSPARSPGTPRR